MSQAYLGEVRLFGGNFAPVNFMQCDGSLLPIANYDALFSVIGTAYGGDGDTTFALPDLRGRTPVHQGQGKNLPFYALGQTGGTETVTLNIADMPSHSHALFVSGDPGDLNTAVATTSVVSALGPGDAGINVWQPASNTDQVLGSVASMMPTGGGQPHNNFQPTACATYIICVIGIYPPRS